MTTEDGIKFIRSYHELLTNCRERHSAFATFSFIEGMITFASINGTISFSTDWELKQEVQNIYQKLVASF